MFSDDPTEEQVKEAIEQMDKAALLAKMVADIIPRADGGFVAWNAVPPQGVPWQMHKLSFLDSVSTALAFCQTRAKDEWLVIGQAGFMFLRFLPQFIAVEGVTCAGCSLVYVGKLQTITVYLAPDFKPNDWAAGLFYTADSKSAARGVIIDPPTAFAQPATQAVANAADLRPAGHVEIERIERLTAQINGALEEGVRIRGKDLEWEYTEEELND